MQSTRVLVVEDDSGLRAALGRGLAGSQMDVATAIDGASALTIATATERPFDVIVLDIGLPDADGRDVCLALRARGVTALVLFLTARGQVGDQLSGFASGGDDYLTKPFDFAVLVARVTALAKRSPQAARAAGRKAAVTRSWQSVADCRRRQGTAHPNGNAHSPGLDERRGDGGLRRELVLAVWPTGAVVNDNTLDQYVARIRRKLLKPGTRP